MAEQYYLAAFIAVSAGATFATRVVPFLFSSATPSTPGKAYRALSTGSCNGVACNDFSSEVGKLERQRARVGRLGSRVAGGHHSLVAA